MSGPGTELSLERKSYFAGPCILLLSVSLSFEKSCSGASEWIKALTNQPEDLFHVYIHMHACTHSHSFIKKVDTF